MKDEEAMIYIMNTLNRKGYIILLIVTMILIISVANGLFYWMLEDKFEIDFDSIRQKEIDWMVCSLGFYLLYLIGLLFFFLHKVLSTRKRLLTQREKGLLIELIKRSNIEFPVDWESNLLVAPINGSPGSLLFFPQGVSEVGRTLGIQASECLFWDLDDVAVIAALNLDTQGNLYELDMWKTDFTKIKEIATTFSSVQS